MKPLTIPEKLRNCEEGLTARKLAKILGQPLRTIQQQAKDGKIPNYRPNGKILFDPVLIAQWLEDSRIA